MATAARKGHGSDDRAIVAINLNSLVIACAMLAMLRDSASEAVRYEPPSADLLSPLSPPTRSFITQLMEQAVKSGIDYKTLGQ